MAKVHGGLARAGKVKSHTPKVEKKEKKKPALGRAKKRLQYNKVLETTPLLYTQILFISPRSFGVVLPSPFPSSHGFPILP